MAVDYFAVRPGNPLRGASRVPGDKSISHRAVMFGALAQGATHIRDWLPAGDTEASLAAMRALGVPVDRLSATELIVRGGELRQPDAPLNLVNAGTGIRLLAGIMVGQPFPSVLDGSEQLRRRPMKRIIEPLTEMGANIHGIDHKAPLTIEPARLHGIHYTLPVASAQVKSAILLAGLFAIGETVVTEPGPGRDHTERMLAAMGVDLTVDGAVVTLRPGQPLRPMDFTVPGDFSSAAFLIVAALLIPGSDITLTNISLNPTRTGLLAVLREMGADIAVEETGLQAGDPVGTIRVRHSALHAVAVGGDVVVRMIDEFPIFMVAALAAEGKTTVRDAEELRVKETDRLRVMTAELTRMGARIQEYDDGFSLDGPQTLRGAHVDGHDDHRLSMSLVVAGLTADGDTRVDDARCASDSFPGYAETLVALGAEVAVRKPDDG
ncbi:MAG: 3-phosphoshikimate 1-carboxyvinyltransferase [Anaerolineae bacterium]|nr:3-phosphoshikimate 1-carboxyvinyltransferase [Anaerolineae bacterium]